MGVYNGERYVQGAIDSILRQTLADFEFIIIDDGSTDNTPQILKQAAAQDARIRVFTNIQNVGLTVTLNIGLEIAQGEYIVRQDADDISLPQRLSVQTRYLDGHSEVVLVSANADVIDEAGQIIGYIHRSAPSKVIQWRLQFYNHIAPHSLVMFRREAALCLGGYDETHRYSQDYDLWLRLCKIGTPVILPHNLLQLRQHDEAISHQAATPQETISLQDAKQALDQRLAHPLSPQMVRQCRAFWLEGFHQIENPSHVNHTLWKVYRAWGPSLLVRHDVSRQYILWLRSVSLRQQPRLKLWLAWHMMRWYPLGVVYLMGELWRWLRK